jgi:carnitine 3-dehydrogenase
MTEQERPDPRSPEGGAVGRVAVVGAGTIGSRWTALFLAAGLEVAVVDPAAGAEGQLFETTAGAWHALRRLGLTDLAEAPSPRFVQDLEEAVAGVDWVQENAPEDERLKLGILKDIDAVCPPGAIIASSTSSFLPSTLQIACAHPERVVVGHPFNPVHILPLVEVVGGTQTSADTIARAMRFYAALGKHPLHCRVEVPGFLSNRLQFALDREFLHLVNEGVATTAEIDASITESAGLRWALLGPGMIDVLVGGAGGLAASLKGFDWTKFDECCHMPAPEMTEDLVGKLQNQTDVEIAGRTIAEIEETRDEFLIRLIQLKRELLEATEAKEALEVRMSS